MLREEVLSLPSWVICFNLPALRVSNLCLQVGVHTLEGRSSALAAHLYSRQSPRCNSELSAGTMSPPVCNSALSPAPAHAGSSMGICGYHTLQGEKPRSLVLWFICPSLCSLKPCLATTRQNWLGTKMDQEEKCRLLASMHAQQDEEGGERPNQRGEDNTRPVG